MAKGCDRDAVRSTKKHVIRCFGLKGVSRMRLVPVPWSQRVWALPFLTVLCRPAEAETTLGPLAHGPVVHPQVAPVAIRFVLVCDPEGKLLMEAFFCTDLHTTPAQILQWVVMRWSVEVTCEEARAHLGLETQRQWSDLAIARTTPVLLAVFSIVTVLALELSQSGQIPVPTSAWYHKAEPTFADCLALVRQHLWRARFLVNSTAD